MQTRPEPDHRPSLDLTRSAAIVMVVFFHLSACCALWQGRTPPWWLSWYGVAGVELFFVLSGFLIGRLLLELIEREPTPAAWCRFMMRRWMRTLPLYFLWIAVLLAVSGSPDTKDAPWLLVRYLTLTQNLFWPIASPFFAVSWSLTVEEWFYVAFSGLLVLLARRGSKATSLLVSLGIFCAVPPLARFILFAPVAWDDMIRKVAFLRLDAIAIGVVCATAWRYGTHLLRHAVILACVGLATIGIARAWYPDTATSAVSRYFDAFFFDLTDIGFALMLPLAAGPMPLPAWVGRAGAWLAARSYGIYIMHFTVIAVIGRQGQIHHWPLMFSAAAVVVLTLLLSDLSWRCLEKPILRYRPAQFAFRS